VSPAVQGAAAAVEPANSGLGLVIVLREDIADLGFNGVSRCCEALAELGVEIIADGGLFLFFKFPATAVVSCLIPGGQSVIEVVDITGNDDPRSRTSKKSL